MRGFKEVSAIDKNICEIRIYDPDFNWLNATSQAESVQLERELYGVGKFEIHIHPDKTGALDLCKRNNIIVINGDGRKSGIIRDFSIEELRGGAGLVIFGETGQGFLKQRITVPPTQAQDANALGWDKISGKSETVIKHYVSRNMTNSYDAKRNFPRLAVRPDLKRGFEFPWKSRYTMLSDELFNICSYAEMGHEVTADISAKTWIFDVIDGTDRSREQSQNDPVFFNTKNQNLNGYKYSEDFQNFKNTGYAGGSGEDEKRLVYILGADQTGLARWETFLDCGNAANINELTYYGEQRLNEFKESITVEAGLLPRIFEFEKDYFLGDKVGVLIERLGLSLSVRITAVKEIWERDTGFRQELRFGAKVPNIFTILQKQGVNR